MRAVGVLRAFLPRPFSPRHCINHFGDQASLLVERERERESKTLRFLSLPAEPKQNSDANGLIASAFFPSATPERLAAIN